MRHSVFDVIQALSLAPPGSCGCPHTQELGCFEQEKLRIIAFLTDLAQLSEDTEQ